VAGRRRCVPQRSVNRGSPGGGLTAGGRDRTRGWRGVGVAPGPGRPKQLSLEQAALAECLIELVITFVQRHGFQAKFFVIKNNILPRALQYLHVQPRHVALGTPRSGGGASPGLPTV